MPSMCAAYVITTVS